MRAIECFNLPISRVKKRSIPGQHEYDVIISSGLFDYLNTHTTQGLLAHFNDLLADDGIVTITNFSAEDRSAFAKEWFGDWQLIYRDEEKLWDLFPQEGKLGLTLSENRSLFMVEYGRAN